MVEFRVVLLFYPPPKAIAIDNHLYASINDLWIGDLDADNAIVAFGLGFGLQLLQSESNRIADQLLVVAHAAANQVTDIFANVVDDIRRRHRDAKEQLANFNIRGGWVMIETN